MSEEQRIIAECLRALDAARPFVVDGRTQDEAEEALALVEAASDLAAKYVGDPRHN